MYSKTLLGQSSRDLPYKFKLVKFRQLFQMCKFKLIFVVGEIWLVSSKSQIVPFTYHLL